MTDLLHIRDLRIGFETDAGPFEAVGGASFRVPHGKTVALVGESGSGKSVIAQAIMGILPKNGRISGGEILFDDRDQGVIDIARLPRDGRTMQQLRGGAISIIFQEPMTSLSPVHRIGDQIAEALHLHRNVDKATGRALVREILRHVGFSDPEQALRTYPFELSGGMRQRAMIAMALISRPALLIADEPTTALDVTIQAQILKLMADLQAEMGMALLLITHDLGVVANMADEVAVMYRGKIVEAAPTDAIFEAPQHPYLKALLAAVPRFGMQPGERLVPLRAIRSVTGRMFEGRRRATEAEKAAGPLLVVEGVKKTYRMRGTGFFDGGAASTLTAVQDVSFTVKHGECLGLVGESGCGKTTLSKIIMRAMQPDSGRIIFNDKGRLVDVLGLEGRALDHFRTRIQFVFQDPFGALNPRMTIFDIIAEPLVIHNIGSVAERQEAVKELMALVGLEARDLRRYPHSFSGGQRQRIGIARALALKPDLLILDEPVSALDVSIQAQILNLLKDLQAKLGLTYIFISHNLAVVDYIADRIMVMCAGCIVEVAARQDIFRAPLHPYTKALLAAVPDPSRARRLDFARLMEGRASIPAAWPAPFTVDGDNAPPLTQVAPDHWIRAALPVEAAS